MKDIKDIKVSVIVCMDRNGSIGYKGGIPWGDGLSADKRRFRNTTDKHHVIMGRKTWESLPQEYRPLPGRFNLIVSSNEHYDAPGAVVFTSLEIAVAAAKYAAQVLDLSEVFIAGGGQIYREAFETGIVDKVYATVIQEEFEADVEIFELVRDFRRWEKTEDTIVPVSSKNQWPLNFCTFVKPTLGRDRITTEQDSNGKTVIKDDGKIIGAQG